MTNTYTLLILYIAQQIDRYNNRYNEQFFFNNIDRVHGANKRFYGQENLISLISNAERRILKLCGINDAPIYLWTSALRKQHVEIVIEEKYDFFNDHTNAKEYIEEPTNIRFYNA